MHQGTEQPSCAREGGFELGVSQEGGCVDRAGRTGRWAGRGPLSGAPAQPSQGTEVLAPLKPPGATEGVASPPMSVQLAEDVLAPQPRGHSWVSSEPGVGWWPLEWLG